MNIVILTALFPYPLTSGGAQAQYNMIDKLRYNHKITIIFPERKANSLSAMKELQSKWPEVTFYPYKYWRQLLDPCFFVSKIKSRYLINLPSIKPNSTTFAKFRLFFYIS